MRVVFILLLGGLLLSTGCRNNAAFKVEFGLIGKEDHGVIGPCFRWTTTDDFIRYIASHPSPAGEIQFEVLNQNNDGAVHVAYTSRSKAKARLALEQMVSGYIWIKMQQREAEASKAQEDMKMRLPLVIEQFGAEKAEEIRRRNLGPYVHPMPVIISDDQ